MTHRSRRVGRVAAAAVAALLGVGMVAGTASAGDGNAKAKGRGDNGNVLVPLQLLAFNDFHGNVEATTPGTFYDTDPAAQVPAGGAEYLSTKLSELRAGHDNTLTVAAGDLIGASPVISGLFHDEPAVESLNAMHLDISSVGNHEFDEGVTELLRVQNGGCHPVDGCYFPNQPYAGADYQYLAANVVDDSTGRTVLPPYEIRKVQGIKVGFIGMTLEGTTELVSPDGIEGYSFLDEAETANKLVPILEAQGVRAIVVLLHEGASPTPTDYNSCTGVGGPVMEINAALDPQIDAIISGHTHEAYNCRVSNGGGGERLLTSSYSYGRVVTDMELVLDKRTRDVRMDLSKAWNYPVLQADLTKDPKITAVIDKWTPLFQEQASKQVGTITADIKRGNLADSVNKEVSTRGVESSLGNLVADDLKAAGVNAEFSLLNPGGLRNDLLYADSGGPGDAPGVVTWGEAFAVQPFGNAVVTLPLTGDQIKRILDLQCKPGPQSSHPVLALSVSQGVTFDMALDVTTTTVVGPDGAPRTTKECHGIRIDKVMINGEPLDLTRTYRVATNNFLAAGGDGFTPFAETSKNDWAQTMTDVESLAAYLTANSPVSPPAVDRVNEVAW